MRHVLLASVAFAALSLSPALMAQERNPNATEQQNRRTQTQQTQEQKPAAQDKQDKSAQSQDNRGATQSGHETGKDRAQQQRSQTGPGHATGQDRAEERRSPSAQGRGPDHETGQDRAQQQREQREQRGIAQQQQQRDQTRDRAQTQDRNQDRTQAQDRNQRTQDRNQAQDRNQRSPDRQGAQRDQTQQQQQGRDSTQDRDQNCNRDTARSTDQRSGSTSVDVTGSIRVDQQKASRVHEELISRGERSNVNITVDIGQRIPDRVRLRPLPTSIISISPEFRGYSYVVVHDEIVIVEPRTKKVVTIIRSGGNRSGVVHRSSLRLEQPQISRIRREIRLDGMRRFNIDVRPGMMVPQNVVLQPLPDIIVEEIPEVREYRFFVDRDDIVLVDPKSREVVEILR